jgi:hypothetical protein
VRSWFVAADIAACDRNCLQYFPRLLPIREIELDTAAIIALMRLGRQRDRHGNPVRQMATGGVSPTGTGQAQYLNSRLKDAA